MKYLTSAMTAGSSGAAPSAERLRERRVMPASTVDISQFETQVLDTEMPGIGHVLHLRVLRYDDRDGITWDELQAVKNWRLGHEVRAIEIFPPESEMVNQANVRHLWVIPDDVALPNMKRFW
jgi:hypothetical protein